MVRVPGTHVGDPDGAAVLMLPHPGCDGHWKSYPADRRSLSRFPALCHFFQLSKLFFLEEKENRARNVSMGKEETGPPSRWTLACTGREMHPETPGARGLGGSLPRASAASAGPAPPRQGQQLWVKLLWHQQHTASQQSLSQTDGERSVTSAGKMVKKKSTEPGTGVGPCLTAGSPRKWPRQPDP